MARKDLARLGVAVAILLGGLSQAQAAGLFEGLARAIFGSPRLYASPIYERDEPPRPRQRHRAPEVASKPTPPVVALDPQTDPYWYLKDPTLRRGDIVVTAACWSIRAATAMHRAQPISLPSAAATRRAGSRSCRPQPLVAAPCSTMNRPARKPSRRRPARATRQGLSARELYCQRRPNHIRPSSPSRQSSI